MKRFLVALFATILVLSNLCIAGVAQAQPLVSASILAPIYLAETPSPVQDIITKLETEILPQIETILTPEQREALQIDVSEGGASFRKALKSLSVTPEQKTQLKALIKSLPKEDAFATLTPEERKQFFMKKKEYFMPTAEEISEKISSKMKLAKDKGGFMAKDSSFMPTAEEISEKISEKMKMIKAKVETQLETITAE
jgi:hypothetical protein